MDSLIDLTTNISCKGTNIFLIMTNFYIEYIIFSKKIGIYYDL